MAQHAGESADDGKPQSDTPGVARAGLAATKLDEDRFALGFRNTGPGVVHLDANRLIPDAASHQHGAAWRISQRIDQQILQDPPQHQRIGMDETGRRDDFECQLSFCRDRAEFLHQRLEQRRKRDGL
jgi:hypothetical protein